MDKETQSRKWQITINNPQKTDYSHERIKQSLETLKSLVYWCMSDEIGENQTYHTHLYIASASAIRFSTIKNLFQTAHIEMARGTSSQNKDYVFKEGKWKTSEKHSTNLRETHEEYGEMPIERQGARNDLNDLYDMIKQGYTNFQIIEENPTYMLNIEKIERARQIIKEDKYKDTFRQMETYYLHGPTGTGKTRYVMEKYGYSNVFRITDYEHPFDSYKGQDVIAFEEFRSSLKIQDMLNYLDGYPLELPCRYANKIACYTKVYIISNVPINQQYTNIQNEQILTWEAFRRRIKKVVQYPQSIDTTPLTVNPIFDILP